MSFYTARVIRVAAGFWHWSADFRNAPKADAKSGALASVAMAAVSNRSKTTLYSITSSATASSLGGNSKNGQGREFPEGVYATR
jgi:hypothetical protein